MRKPRCAEGIAPPDDKYLKGYVTCLKEVPCPDHPNGKTDTVAPTAEEVQAMMNSQQRAALDRHITGNWGENQFKSDEAPCKHCGEPEYEHCQYEPVDVDEADEADKERRQEERNSE